MIEMRSIVFGLTLSASVATSKMPGQQKECSANAQALSAAREDADRLLVSGRVREALAPLKRAFGMCPNDADNARELASASIEAGDTAYSETLISPRVRGGEELLERDS